MGKFGGILAYLFTAAEEELERVNAIADRAADNRKPMKDHWRLIGVLEEDLERDVHQHGEGHKGHQTDAAQNPEGLGRALLAELVEHSGEQPHRCATGRGRDR